MEPPNIPFTEDKAARRERGSACREVGCLLLYPE